MDLSVVDGTGLVIAGGYELVRLLDSIEDRAISSTGARITVQIRCRVTKFILIDGYDSLSGPFEGIQTAKIRISSLGVVRSIFKIFTGSNRCGSRRNGTVDIYLIGRIVIFHGFGKILDPISGSGSSEFKISGDFQLFPRRVVSNTHIGTVVIHLRNGYISGSAKLRQI